MMHPPQHALPRFLLEDYLATLRGLVILAWLALLAAVAIQISIRTSDVLYWPELGGFPETYNAVLLEFALNTLVLTVLLLYRDWYERVPRDSAHRVRWLLVAVLFWEGLHLFAAFHVTGSIRGPLFLLLPLILIAALALFPGRGGWWLFSYLIIGHGIVLLLENLAVINPTGPLSSAFSYAWPFTGLGMTVLLLELAAVLALSHLLRQRLFRPCSKSNPTQRIDAETGLYRRSFLERRIQLEIGRMRRQGGSMALLMIAFDHDASVQAESVPNASLTQALLAQLRLESDTPATYACNTLAILLPSAAANGADTAARRVIAGLSATGVVRGFRSAAVVLSPTETSASEIMAQAEHALARAQPGADTLIVASASAQG